MAQAIIALTERYGRYGHRRITALLQHAGWHVGKDRDERIWRREGLKVPQKQKPRGRLWLDDRSCVRLRRTHANHEVEPASKTGGLLSLGRTGEFYKSVTSV